MADFVECKNGVWQHFLREKGGQAGQCKLCKTKLKTVEGSTKGLHEHLKRVHQITLLKRQMEQEDDDKSPMPATMSKRIATASMSPGQNS